MLQKACIMAGGKGTRLMPITANNPKPLVPLLSKPMIFYILDLLETHKVSKAVVALGHQGEYLQSVLTKSDYNSVDLSYVIEDVPLGTAGAVKNCMSDCDEDFIVISGDAMCDFDLEKAVAFHKKNKSMATIIACHVDDPREYGLVHCEVDGRVESFIEKPSYYNCYSDLASTGIYILSPIVLTLIKEKQNCDFAKDVFPKMLKDNMPIFAYEDSGYWCDIGDIKSYMKCQRDMLEQKVRFKLEANCTGGIYHTGQLPLHGGPIVPPAFIGNGVTIGEGVVIGANCIISDNVTIGDRSVMSGTILHEGTYVCSDSEMEDAICCSGVRVECGAQLNEGSVVGQNATIGKDATIAGGVKVWANKTVPSGMMLKEDLQQGLAREIIIEEDGISGQTNSTVTPELCSKIGSSVASICAGGTVGVAFSNHSSAQALCYSMTAGLMAAGSNVWTFGECIESQFKFCLMKSQVEFGVFIEGETVTTIKLFEKGAMPTSRTTERKLEAAINRGEYKRTTPTTFGSAQPMKNLRELYAIELLKLCDAHLEGLKVTVKSSDKRVKSLLEGVLIRLGCTIADGITISLQPGGVGVSFSQNKSNYLFNEQVLALVCMGEFLKGETVSIPHTAPHIIDQIGAKYNKLVYRYQECPCDDCDKVARQKAISKPFLRDGLMLTIKLLSFMRNKQITYSELVELVPKFNVSTRLVSIKGSPGDVIKRLNCEKKPQGEGVIVTREKVSALIRPIKSGKALMIYSESLKSETAAEICDLFEAAIKDTPVIPS